MRGRLVRRLFVAASALVLIPACGDATGGDDDPIPVPGAFSLVAPADLSTSVSTTPSLTWTASADAASYVVQLALNATFTPVLMEERGITGLSGIPTLTHGTTYYWRVAATNSTGSVVATGGPRSFTTVVAAAVVPPAPVVSVTNPNRLPSFTWSAVLDAESYTLEIDQASTGFASPVVTLTGVKATFATSTAVLAAGNYEVRVRAVNTTGSGPWSVVPSPFSPNNAAGSLDTTLGGSGRIALSVGTGLDQANAVAVDAAGNIVLAGSAATATGLDMAVVRLRPDGFPDVFFGSNGRVTTDFNGLNDEALALVIQGDGQIVVAGYAGTVGRTVMAAARYTASGALDLGFNGGGLLALTAVGTGNAVARGVGLTGTDIVIGGDDASTNMLFVRVDAGGTPNAAFGTSGVAALAVGANARLAGLAVQADGKVVGAGVITSPDEDAVVVRLNTNGTADAGFGAGGVSILALDASLNDAAQGVTIGSGGEIILAGYRAVLINSDLQPAIMRVSAANGSLVASTTSSFGIQFTSLDSANAVVVDGSGSIITAGLATEPGPDQDFAFIRYSSTGVEDAAFGTSGKARVELTSTSEQALGVALHADGRIVAAGFTSAFGTRDIAVVRLWP